MAEQEHLGNKKVAAQGVPALVRMAVVDPFCFPLKIKITILYCAVRLDLYNTIKKYCHFLIYTYLVPIIKITSAYNSLLLDIVLPKFASNSSVLFYLHPVLLAT